MINTYSYGKQLIDDNDIQTVIKVLKSELLTQGPTLKLFEDALCNKIGADYASVVSNGTAGLHLVGLALKWKKGDIILTSPITFLATANCILYSGATPDFVDIDKKSYTIDINKLEDKIRNYHSRNKKIKAVIPVDYAGYPCDWESLRFLADKYDFQLIDDACHALGAKYKDDAQYALKFADIAVYSFHPVKHITTGEGGAVLTNIQEIDERIKLLRTHGMEKKTDWYYEMHEPGFNYRITDIQCALGLSQLNKLDGFIQKRQVVAEFYDRVFGNDKRFIIPKKSMDIFHAYHLYPLQVNLDVLKINREEMLYRLKDKNIFCQIHYIPIHLQPYYQQNFGFKPGDFPVSENFYEQEISLPIYPQLVEEDLTYISKTINEVTN